MDHLSGAAHFFISSSLSYWKGGERITRNLMIHGAKLCGTVRAQPAGAHTALSVAFVVSVVTVLVTIE